MTCNIPTEAEIPQLISLWKDVFGEFGDFWEDFLRTGFSRQRCLCLMENEEILAALTWIDCTLGNQKLAYLYAVLTRPDHQGRGLCRQLMTQTHAYLKNQGYTAALLVSADGGLRQMYGTMGYRNCAGIQEFSCQAGEGPVPLSPLTAAEFARKRRELLPPGSVVQEGAGLDFLATQESFWSGEDFLLAGHIRDDSLKAVELLGNISAAPGILKALGCKTGTFRCPGNMQQPAMYHPLTPNAEMPQYFAFDFD